MDSVVTSILDAIESRFYGLFDFFSDPFWGWLFIGIVIIAAVLAICYFFSGVFPILRPIGGVILLLVTFGLYSFHKGEKDQQARDRKR